MKRYDVLVIGGGPVGSHVGAGLAKAGLDVAVLEKKTDTSSPVCCTGLVSTDCVERFPVPPELIVNRFKDAVIVSPSGREISVRRDQVQAVCIDRSRYDSWMANQAVESGVEYLGGHLVSGLSVHHDGVTVKVQKGSASQLFESRVIVLASGFGGNLASSVGMGKAGDWKMGVQSEVELCKETTVRIYVSRHFAPGAFAWLVPLDTERGLAGLITKKNTRRHFGRFLDQLYSDGRIQSKPVETMIRGITTHSPPRTFTDRVLLVGDGAGQVKPLTGGGIYYGLQCGEIAIDCLKNAFQKNDFSAGYMSLYQREWRKLLGRELSVSYQAARFYGGLSDGWLERLLKVAARRNLFNNLAGDSGLLFDWHSQVIIKAARRFLLNI